MASIKHATKLTRTFNINVTADFICQEIGYSIYVDIFRVTGGNERLEQVASQKGNFFYGDVIKVGSMYSILIDGHRYDGGYDGAQNEVTIANKNIQIKPLGYKQGTETYVTIYTAPCHSGGVNTNSL